MGTLLYAEKKAVPDWWAFVKGIKEAGRKIGQGGRRKDMFSDPEPLGIISSSSIAHLR